MSSIKPCTSFSYVYFFDMVIVYFKVTFSFYCKDIEYIYTHICYCLLYVAPLSRTNFSAIFITIIYL